MNAPCQFSDTHLDEFDGVFTDDFLSDDGYEWPLVAESVEPVSFQAPTWPPMSVKADMPHRVTNIRTVGSRAIPPGVEYTYKFRLPVTVDDMQQCIVDAIAVILPIDARVMIFGMWHAVVLVGVLYRHDNLCWVMLNRSNYKLYLVNHFVSDGIHLFESLRYDIQNLPTTQSQKMWCRQGVPEVLCLFRTFTDMTNRNGFKINLLPPEILRTNRTQHGLQKTTEFLRGVGNGGAFLSLFHRTQPPPMYFSPIIFGLTEGTRGWRIFNPSRSMSGQCIGGKRKECCARYIQHLKSVGIQDMDPIEAAIQVVEIIPSRFDDTQNTELCNHYKDFIQTVQAHPTLMFLPSADQLVSDQ